MAIKLATAARHFIPDVSFTMEENGEEFVKANRDLPADEQVRCEISIATIGQKAEYLGSYTVGDAKKMALGGEIKQFTVFQYEKCVRKHVKKITGLGDYHISGGRDLCDKAVEYPELMDIIQDCFFKINGIHADDISVAVDKKMKKKHSEALADAGEMDQGESKASA